MTDPTITHIHPNINGINLEGKVTIDAQAASQGCQIHLAIHRGESAPTEVMVAIPTQINSGATLRIPEMGLRPGGHLFLRVEVEAPKGPRVIVAELVSPPQPSSAPVVAPQTTTEQRGIFTITKPSVEPVTMEAATGAPEVISTVPVAVVAEIAPTVAPTISAANPAVTAAIPTVPEPEPVPESESESENHATTETSDHGPDQSAPKHHHDKPKDIQPQASPATKGHSWFVPSLVVIAIILASAIAINVAMAPQTGTAPSAPTTSNTSTPPVTKATNLDTTKEAEPTTAAPAVAPPIEPTIDPLDPQHWTEVQKLSYRWMANAMLDSQNLWQGKPEQQPYLILGVKDAVTQEPWRFPRQRIPFIDISKVTPRATSNPKSVETWGPMERLLYTQGRGLADSCFTTVMADRSMIALAATEALTSKDPSPRWQQLMQGQFLGQALKEAVAERVKSLEAEETATLDRLAAEPGNRRLPSGLIVGPIHGQGTGPYPGTAALISVSLTARLPDGTVVLTRRESEQTMVGRLWPGLREGLSLLRSGQETVFHIPHRLVIDPLTTTRTWNLFNTPCMISVECKINSFDGAYPIDFVSLGALHQQNQREEPLPFVSPNSATVMAPSQSWRGNLADGIYDWTYWQIFSYNYAVKYLAQNIVADYHICFTYLDLAIMDRLNKNEARVNSAFMFGATSTEWPGGMSPYWDPDFDPINGFIPPPSKFQSSDDWPESYRLAYSFGYRDVYFAIKRLHLDPSAVRLGLMHSITKDLDSEQNYPLQGWDQMSKFPEDNGFGYHLFENRGVHKEPSGLLWESVSSTDDERTLGNGLNRAQVRIRSFNSLGEPLKERSDYIGQFDNKTLTDSDIGLKQIISMTRVGETRRAFIGMFPLNPDVTKGVLAGPRYLRSSIDGLDDEEFLIVEVSVLGGS